MCYSPREFPAVNAPRAVANGDAGWRFVGFVWDSPQGKGAICACVPSVFFAAAIVLIAASAFAQEASIFGTVADSTSGALPGVSITATSLATGRIHSDVSDERGEYRLRGLRARPLQAAGRAFGLRHHRRARRGAAGRAEPLGALRHAGGDADRDGHRHRRIAAGRHQLDAGGRQRRSPPDGGAAAAGPQLDGAGDAGQGHHRQRTSTPTPACATAPSSSISTARRSPSRWPAAASGSRSSAARRSPSSRWSPTCSTSPRAGRSASRCRRCRARAPTTWTAASTATSATRSLNSEDFIANRVLPYANQQIGGAIGGPIVRDKLHYFLSYERENEPNTILSSPAALPGFNWSFDTKLVQNSFLGKGDWQIRQGDHFTTRWSYWDWGNPFTQVAGTEHPSQAADRSRKAFNVSNTWANVISDTAIQEVRVSYSHFDWKNLLAESALANTPNYVFPTITIGQRRNYPQEFYQNTWALRYDLTTNVGAHDLKVGAEYLRWHDTGQWQLLSRGEFIFNSTPADLARRFPQDAWNDPTRWDLTGLDSTLGRFDQNFGDWTIDIPRPSIALWIGDTWKINNSLTINGGVRWDADFGALDPPHITTTVTFDPRPGYVGQQQPPAGRSPLSGRSARHRQHRPARRLHLERRRQRHLRGPRRQRPLLQHPRLEHDLQPPVVQRRAHPGELVPQRRSAGLHRQPDPRRHRGRHPERQRAAAGAVAAGDRQRLSDAPHLAEQRRLPDPVRPAVGPRRRPDPLEGLQLRPPARSEPGLQPGERLQPGADPGQPAGSQVRADPVARVDRQGRLPGPAERHHQALLEQLAGRR